MKIVAWNLNHRTIAKKIPLGVMKFLEAYGPDVVILTEYVDDGSRAEFLEAAKRIGYFYSLASEYAPKSNQVLILAKIPMVPGAMRAPQYDVSARTNFLHVRFPERDLDLVGIRAPAYETLEARVAYWEELTALVEAGSSPRTIYMGDMNYDPFVGMSRKSKAVSFSLGQDFYIPNPKGDWSYISIDGKKSSRIDHAVVSSAVVVEGATYLAEWGGIILAGPGGSQAISDHAVLSIVVR